MISISKHIDKLLKEEFEFVPRNIDKREEERKKQELVRIKKITSQKIWKTDLDLRDNEYLTDLSNLEIVEGDLDLNSCTNLLSLGNLEVVEGDLDLFKCENLTSLGNLKVVRGGLHLSHCQNLTSLGNLEVVEGDLDLFKCENLISLGNLKIVGRDLYSSYSGINYIPENVIIGGSIGKLNEYNKIWNGPNKIKEFNEWHRKKGLIKEQFEFIPRNIEDREKQREEETNKRFNECYGNDIEQLKKEGYEIINQINKQRFLIREKDSFDRPYFIILHSSLNILYKVDIFTISKGLKERDARQYYKKLDKNGLLDAVFDPISSHWPIDILESFEFVPRNINGRAEETQKRIKRKLQKVRSMYPINTIIYLDSFHKNPTKDQVTDNVLRSEIDQVYDDIERRYNEPQVQKFLTIGEIYTKKSEFIIYVNAINLETDEIEVLENFEGDPDHWFISTENLNKRMIEQFEFVPRNIDKREEEKKRKELEIIKKVQTTEIWEGDLDLTGINITTLGELRIIKGSLILPCNNSIETFSKLEKVEGSINALVCVELKSLGNLKYVEGQLNLDGCVKLTDASKLEKVGRRASFYSCKSLEELPALKFVNIELNIHNTKIKTLPSSLKVNGYISNNNIPNSHYWSVEEFNNRNDYLSENLIKEEFSFVPRNIDKRERERKEERIRKQEKIRKKEQKNLEKISKITEGYPFYEDPKNVSGVKKFRRIFYRSFDINLDLNIQSVYTEEVGVIEIFETEDLNKVKVLSIELLWYNENQGFSFNKKFYLKDKDQPLVFPVSQTAISTKVGKEIKKYFPQLSFRLKIPKGEKNQRLMLNIQYFSNKKNLDTLTNEQLKELITSSELYKSLQNTFTKIKNIKFYKPGTNVSWDKFSSNWETSQRKNYHIYAVLELSENLEK